MEMELENENYKQAPEKRGGKPAVEEETTQCIICTEKILYYAIPETCNHNLICWNCILKQRLKLNQNACPACKEESSRVLITMDPTQTIKNWNTNMIEDVTKNIVYQNPAVKTEISRKIEFYCSKCEQQ